MRKYLIAVLVLSLATACISKKTAQKSGTNESTVPPKVFSVPGTATEPAKKPATTSTTTTAATPPKTSEKPVAVRKEQVSFTQPSDKTQNESNTYFVIIGSFSQLENAKNYRQTLINDGFTPIILHSETGYYRICSNSYKTENEARNRISQIRTDFPKYSDVWLLIKE